MRITLYIWSPRIVVIGVYVNKPSILYIDEGLMAENHYNDVIMDVMAFFKSPASRLFIQSFVHAQIKENIKAPRHWPLWGELPVTGEFPAQRASNAENVSIWWRHNKVRYHLCTSYRRNKLLSYNIVSTCMGNMLPYISPFTAYLRRVTLFPPVFWSWSMIINEYLPFFTVARYVEPETTILVLIENALRTDMLYCTTSRFTVSCNRNVKRSILIQVMDCWWMVDKPVSKPVIVYDQAIWAHFY